ncbi:phage holin [Terrihalobacillus insolitus]|uniref:phage holin n=1 Tax=Terrihalobacillus insolitus TaxID=2950438 RepID=UPI002340414B|nr:phage holin [Terrihalobacillus insolitus]MDC3414258.1 SPP1 phage holin family protein [Terrihalobacillus insolitus]
MDKASITRLVALVVSLVGYFGINVPSNVQELLVFIVFTVVSAYGFWKNNYISQKGKKQKEVIEREGLK